MRKKWVIIAAALFLGVTCGLIILDKQNRYTSEEVIAEMDVHGSFYDFTGTGCAFGNSVGIKSGKTSVIDRMVDWYEAFRANRKMSSSECLYSKTGSDYYSWITIYVKNDRVIKVEIEPEHETEAAQDALDLQSNLSKAFPDLPCEIIGSK